MVVRINQLKVVIVPEASTVAYLSRRLYLPLSFGRVNLLSRIVEPGLCVRLWSVPDTILLLRWPATSSIDSWLVSWDSEAPFECGRLIHGLYRLPKAYEYYYRRMLAYLLLLERNLCGCYTNFGERVSPDTSIVACCSFLRLLLSSMVCWAIWLR